MKIGNLNLPGQVLLAPLAGVSNRPFRMLARRSGAACTYTEMISCEGVIRRHGKTLSMMEFGDKERPLGIQLFGANPNSMAQATQFAVEQFNPDLIDLNFGCPVKKVVNKNGGAAVLKDLGLTEEIMAACVAAAGETPVTVKMRTGWDEAHPVYYEVAEIADKVGLAAITLHARSRAKGYSGQANWLAIRQLKEASRIPVIGNGDIKSPSDAKRMLDETGCDGVMIGRAALGDPLIFERINQFLQTGKEAGIPKINDRIDVALEHSRLMIDQFGEHTGAKMMRRILGWYVRGFPGATRLRPLLFQASSFDDINDVFENYLTSSESSIKRHDSESTP